jgi:hypothetical protein
MRRTESTRRRRRSHRLRCCRRHRRRRRPAPPPPALGSPGSSAGTLTGERRRPSPPPRASWTSLIPHWIRSRRTMIPAHPSSGARSSNGLLTATDGLLTATRTPLQNSWTGVTERSVTRWTCGTRRAPTALTGATPTRTLPCRRRTTRQAARRIASPRTRTEYPCMPAI